MKYLIETDGQGTPYVLYAISPTVAVELAADGEWRDIDANMPPAMIEFDFMANDVGALVSKAEAEQIAKGWGALLKL